MSRSDLRLYWDKYDATACNFWGISADIYKSHPESDEMMIFNTQMCAALIRGHILYEERFEEFCKNSVEPFPNLGSFCLGCEYLDELMKDLPFLKGK